MQARKLVCSCDACICGRYESCSKQVQLGGKMKRVAVTVIGDGLNQPQLANLEQWSKYLSKGTIFAVNSDPNERREGLYWLAQALGPAYPAPANMVHATDQFEEGWLIAPSKVGVRHEPSLPLPSSHLTSTLLPTSHSSRTCSNPTATVLLARADQ